VWQGDNYIPRGLAILFWGAVRIALAIWMWGTATRLAYYPAPMKTVGAVLAVLSLVVILWGVWGLWKSIRSLGVKGILFVAMIVYLLLVVFNVLTIPDEHPVQDRIYIQLGATARQVWGSMHRGISALAKAPDEFLLAYTGIGSAAQPAGFPAPDPESTLVLVVAQPQPASSSSELKVGGYARVNQISGQMVVVREAPRLDSPVTASFPNGERLLILEGAVEKEAGVWWKVHGRQGEGWCLAEWLEPSK
jgi:hypothetical protein